MPDRVKFLQAKRRLQKGLRKIIRDAEQIGRDVAWWNQNRTDAPPLDRGGDLVVVSLAKQALALVEAEQPFPDELMARLKEQIRANASR